jgi:hypothetical protein
MAIAEVTGRPLAAHTASANPHEVTLVEATVDAIVIVGLPERRVGDRAYDSDPLDEKLTVDGIEVIATHRKKRVRPAIQDGRVLRRYKRRWKIERLFAWLINSDESSPAGNMTTIDYQSNPLLRISLHKFLRFHQC